MGFARLVLITYVARDKYQFQTISQTPTSTLIPFAPSFVMSYTEALFVICMMCCLKSVVLYPVLVDMRTYFMKSGT